jgi:hypothetical protein
MTAVNRKALALMEYLIRYIEKNGYQPRFKEMAAALKVTQVVLFKHLRALDKADYIRLTGRERAIAIIGFGFTAGQD